MDPLFMLEAVGFRATSGNQVVRVIELGEDGMIPSWRLEPSSKDQDEFIAWSRTKLPPGTEIDTHMGGAGEAGLERSRQAYAAWKKKLEGI